MPGSLERIEQAIRTFVESSSSWFGTKTMEEQLAFQLISAMRSAAKTSERGHLIAPDRFMVSADTQIISKLEKSNDFRVSILKKLQVAASSEGYQFIYSPELIFISPSSSSQKGFHIVADYQEDRIGSTAAIATAYTEEKSNSKELDVLQAFVIMNGSKTIPLRKTVINIGRLPENEICLKSPHVSRRHSQLRYSFGGFIIFDLDSSVGTIVNGARISQHALLPGDVISIADVQLVYGEDRVESKKDSLV